MFGRRKKAARPENLFEGMLRGVPGSRTHGTSAARFFPSVDDLARDQRLHLQPGNPEGKTFVGVVGAQMKPLQRPGSYSAQGGVPIAIQDDRHRLLLAGSRAGKGRSILLPQMVMDTRNSLLSVDPKGSHASATLEWRAHHGQTCGVLDPARELGSWADPYRVSFNPMQHGDWDDPNAVYERCAEISDALVIPSGEGREDHWDASASNFLRGVCAHVMTSERFTGKRDLVEVFKLVMGEAGNDESDLAIEMIGSTAVQGFVAAAGSAFFTVQDRERSSILSTLRRHLAWIGMPAMQDALKDSDFNTDDFLSKPMSFYVSLPARLMGACAGLPRLVLSCAISGFERNPARHAHQDQSGEHTCQIVIDEYAVIGRLKVLEVAAAQLAGMGARLTIAAQDINQLAAIHGDRWETLAANAGLVTCFGNTDVRTLKWSEDRLGTTEIRTFSQSDPSLRSALDHGERGVSTSSQTHPLMTKSEIAQTFDRDDPLARMLVFLPSIGPVVVQRALLDQHELFAPYRAFMDQQRKAKQ